MSVTSWIPRCLIRSLSPHPRGFLGFIDRKIEEYEEVVNEIFLFALTRSGFGGNREPEMERDGVGNRTVNLRRQGLTKFF